MVTSECFSAEVIITLLIPLSIRYELHSVQNASTPQVKMATGEWMPL